MPVVDATLARRVAGAGPGGDGYPADPTSIDQPRGCTLADYADAKHLSVDFLKGLGLSEISYLGEPAVRIPYLDRTGAESAVRIRTALAKGSGADQRFRWRKGSKPSLYGLWRLDRSAKSVIVVEGESDCHTMWFYGIACVGVPGAAAWNDERDAAHLDGVDAIYVVHEPDQGGDTVLAWLAKSRIRHRVKIVSLAGHKDPSALYIAGSAGFKAAWDAAIASAAPWATVEATQMDEGRREAWPLCQDIARLPDILDRVATDLRRGGLVGEDRTTKLLYLALTSRVLDQPVSVVVKGPSSGGKSFTG